MIAPDLRRMGIKKLDVAEQALQRSVELKESEMNDGLHATSAAANDCLMNPSPRALGRTIFAHANALAEPYVEEPDEPYDLGRWIPPNELGGFPARWFARPPDNVNYRPSALCGWRTNLERAILREDVAKVKEIVAKRNKRDVREYVECRMLLTKCAQRGLIVACKLLIEDCAASVEGAQAPDAESWWIGIQDVSGNYESLTPLHQAARNGQVETLRFLLDHGADINRIDKAHIRGSALHYAVSGGQIDCCRILCERGADLTYGEFLPALSMSMFAKWLS